MASMRNAAALALVLALALASPAQARWVVFGEVLAVSQPNTVDTTPTTYLVIQEQPVDESPIAILDAWETVDDSMEGFWNSLLLPRRAPAIPNPISWVYQQLQAVDDFQRTAFNDMVSGGSRSGRETVQMESPDVASVEQMLRNVGCNRFRPAMQDYEQQQNLFSIEPEVHSDMFLSTMLAGRVADYAAEDYAETGDYAEDYVGDYGALRTAGDYRTGRAAENSDSERSSRNVPLSRAQSRLRGAAAQEQEDRASSAAMNELADSILSMLGGQVAVNTRIQETTLGRVANDALQVEYMGAEDAALSRAERDSLLFQQGGVERTHNRVAPADDDEEQQPSSITSSSSGTFSASLTWSREGGLVLEAESSDEAPQSTAAGGVAAASTGGFNVDGAAAELAQYVTFLKQQQQLQQEAQQQEVEAQRMPEYLPNAVSSSSRRRGEQQVAEARPQQMLLADVLRREQQQQQTVEEQSAKTKSILAGVATPRVVSTSSSEQQQQQGSTSFAVSWSRDGGLMIETYDASADAEARQGGGDADAYSSDSYDDDAGASTSTSSGASAGYAGPFDSGFEWQPMPAYVVDDDLVWSWTDEEGNLNWGLLVLTLLVVSSAVVAVAAVQSYLALHGAVCAAACAAACRAGAAGGCCPGSCGGKRAAAARRLSEPLLLAPSDEEVEGSCDEGRYVVPPLVVTHVAGAKEMPADGASYSVEYAALYAQAQGRGRQ